MDELAAKADAGYRAEAYLRAGDQWVMAGDAQRAADDFRAAIADGGQPSADPRVYLARALLDLGQDSEAEDMRHPRGDPDRARRPSWRAGVGDRGGGALHPAR